MEDEKFESVDVSVATEVGLSQVGAANPIADHWREEDRRTSALHHALNYYEKVCSQYIGTDSVPSPTEIVETAKVFHDYLAGK